VILAEEQRAEARAVLDARKILDISLVGVKNRER
jgi:hypothetical protein